MALQKIIIEIGGKTDLDSTLKKLQELGLIDEKNAETFKKNNQQQQGLVNNLRKKIEDLTAARDRSNNPKSIERFNALIAETTKQYNKLTGVVEDFGKKQNDNTKKLSAFQNVLNSVGPALAGAFAVNQLVNFGKQVVDTTAKFQKFEAVLVNTLGSKSAAQRALKDIKDFAAQTPFAVSELTESFVKLANQGFKPTTAELRKLGDLAASTGKGFDQLTEAIIDAQTGEFERLKEFGIRAQKEGDKVTFTFKGVKQQVDFTGDSIRKYILSLGDAAGVSGSMAAISKTLGGQISNLGDAYDGLLVAIGDRYNDAISEAIANTSDFVTALKEIAEVPVSQKLEEERIELNALVTQIISANENNEKRKTLLTELNAKYPEFLGMLNIEKVTNEQLAARLKEINQQYVNKIIIQEKQEEIEESLRDLAKERIEILKQEKQLQKEFQAAAVGLNVSNQILGKTLEEQAKILDKALDGGTLFQRNLREIREAETDLSEVEKEAIDLQTEKLELMRRLGIEEEKSVETTQEQTKAMEQQVPTLKKLKDRVSELQDRVANTPLTFTEYIAGMREEIKVTQELIDKLEGKDQASKDFQKALKDKQEFDKNYVESNVQIATKDPFTDPTLIKEQADERVKIWKDRMNREKKEVIDPFIEYQKLKSKEQTEDEQKQSDRRKEIRQREFDFAIQALSAIADEVNSRNQLRADAEIQKLDEQTNAEIKALDKRKEAKVISEEAYERAKENIQKKAAARELEIRRKQAKAEKETALFQIALNTAAAIIKQLAVTPLPAGAPLVALIAAQGAIQAGIVASRPLPAFKDGVVDFKGKGTATSDSNIVRISSGESVVPAEPTRKYRKELQAMLDGTYEKYKLPVISKKSLTEARHNDMAENIYRSMQLQGVFDDQKIVNAIKDTKRMEKQDVKLAKMIGNQISDRISEDRLYK